MRIAHARREEMQELDNCHGGAGPILFKSLYEKADFQTPWWFVHSAILLPGGGIGHHRHDNCEEIFVTIDNAAQFTHNGRTTEIVGAAAVPVRRGESHAIYNHTDRETRWFNFNVAAPGYQADSTDHHDNRAGAPLESTDRLPIGRLDRNLLQYGRLHEGKGEVGRREIWGHQDFQTTLGFLVHCLLPPDTSIGYHRHEILEECYIIVNGSGRMTGDDETIEVYPGNAILNHMGGSHGIYNHTQEDLELFLVAVCMEKGKFDCTDLGDDLSRR
jgi:mannose-6-phosphate isomerase-like protein (cupin superfamily)